MLFRFPRLLSPEPGDGGGAGGDETVAIQHGDQTINIPRTALKGWVNEKELGEKYIPRAAHNDQMARMRRDYDAVKDRKSADDLLEDQEFRTKAQQHWGIDPNATNKQFQQQLEKQRNEFLEREVKPRDAKLTAAHETIDQLLVKDLYGQITLAAKEAGIDEKFTKRPARGGKPLIVAMLEESFDFDPERGEWFAKGQGQQQFAFSSNGSDEVPYMGVQEFISGWLTSKEGSDFRRAERQAGAEAGAGAGRKEGQGLAPGQVGNEIRVTSEQRQDISFMRKVMAKAEKEGLTVVPI